MQKDRLTDEFSTALKNFQTAQRTAAEKERASVQRARAHSGINQVSFRSYTMFGEFGDGWVEFLQSNILFLAMLS